MAEQREWNSTSVIPAQKHIQAQQAGDYLVFFLSFISYILNGVLGSWEVFTQRHLRLLCFFFIRSLFFFFFFFFCCFFFLDECYDTTGRCSGFFVPSQAHYLRYYALFPFTVRMASTKLKDRHCLPKQHTESHSRRYRGLL
ncbi:hypothetical protein QR685DRAFT_80818 [Neurospora intermedia]|uniref:Uncharacterized protein n=1 Tax=Neurospora intermedia TaxID=5142 RepID=A0ABR3D3E6_NEUIN